MDETMKKPGMRGKTEASTTRRPPTPRTLKSLSSTASASPSLPIAQVPQAWCPQLWRTMNWASAAFVASFNTSGSGTLTV